MSKDVSIPVGATFEKRLAELVWENCPDLARQTAAGKLALSLDIDKSAVQGMVLDDLRDSIRAWVEEQIPIVKEKVLSDVSDSNLTDEFTDLIRARVRAFMGNLDIANEVGKRIHSAVDKVVQDRFQPWVDEYFGTNRESFHKIIQARIDAYLEKRLGVPETQSAIADGMHRMVARSDS